MFLKYLSLSNGNTYICETFSPHRMHNAWVAAVVCVYYYVLDVMTFRIRVQYLIGIYKSTIIHC